LKAATQLKEQNSEVRAGDSNSNVVQHADQFGHDHASIVDKARDYHKTLRATFLSNRLGDHNLLSKQWKKIVTLIGRQIRIKFLITIYLIGFGLAIPRW